MDRSFFYPININSNKNQTTYPKGKNIMGSEPNIKNIEKRSQPLSGAENSEMGPREIWNEKNPATEAVIIKNLKTTDLTPREFRKTNARFYRLGHGSRLQPHLSELRPLGASVNHRHTTEAVIYIVTGTGHSVISWDGINEERIDWEEGDMFSFPTWMWHQHFNDSETSPCRYLAIQDTFSIKALGLHAIERVPDAPHAH